MSIDSIQTVVLDFGSSFCKCGLAGDDFPKLVFPSIIGKPIKSNKNIGTVAGFDAFSKKDKSIWCNSVKFDYPIRRGVIDSCEDLEILLNYSYFEMKLTEESEAYAMMWMDTPKLPKKNRHDFTQLIFEKFNVPAMYSSMHGVMSLFGCGRVNGIVLESGDGLSYSVPIYEGFALPHAISKMEMAGSDLTKHLQRLMGSNISWSSLEYILDIKNSMCYIANDYEDELRTVTKRSYVLPDQSIVELGKERFQCPEMLFQPNLFESGEQSTRIGIPEAIVNSIELCDLDLRKELFGNVFLSGGNTMFDGISERMTKELSARAPNHIRVSVVASVERKYLTWIGGSIFASMSTFSTEWITKEDYEDVGASIIDRKCWN